MEERTIRILRQLFWEFLANRAVANPNLCWHPSLAGLIGFLNPDLNLVLNDPLGQAVRGELRREAPFLFPQDRGVLKSVEFLQRRNFTLRKMQALCQMSKLISFSGESVLNCEPLTLLKKCINNLYSSEIKRFLIIDLDYIYFLSQLNSPESEVPILERLHSLSNSKLVFVSKMPVDCYQFNNQELQAFLSEQTLFSTAGFLNPFEVADLLFELLNVKGELVTSCENNVSADSKQYSHIFVCSLLDAAKTADEERNIQQVNINTSLLKSVESFEESILEVEEEYYGTLVMLFLKEKFNKVVQGIREPLGDISFKEYEELLFTLFLNKALVDSSRFSDFSRALVAFEHKILSGFSTLNESLEGCSVQTQYEGLLKRLKPSPPQKLLALDLDNTLLFKEGGFQIFNGGKQEYWTQWVSELHAKGIRVIVCTNRSNMELDQMDGFNEICYQVTDSLFMNNTTRKGPFLNWLLVDLDLPPDCCVLLDDDELQRSSANVYGITTPEMTGKYVQVSSYEEFLNLPFIRATEKALGFQRIPEPQYVCEAQLSPRQRDILAARREAFFKRVGPGDPKVLPATNTRREAGMGAPRTIPEAVKSPSA